jgi:hypothetical protein
MVFDDHVIWEDLLLRLKPVIRPERSRATFLYLTHVCYLKDLGVLVPESAARKVCSSSGLALRRGGVPW